MIMAKAKRSKDHDLGTKVSFSTSMCLAYMIVGAEQKNRTAIHVLLQNSWTLQNTSFLDSWTLQQSQTKTYSNTSLLHNATNSRTSNHDYCCHSKILERQLGAQMVAATPENM